MTWDVDPGCLVFPSKLWCFLAALSCTHLITPAASPAPCLSPSAQHLGLWALQPQQAWRGGASLTMEDSAWLAMMMPVPTLRQDPFMGNLRRIEHPPTELGNRGGKCHSVSAHIQISCSYFKFICVCDLRQVSVCLSCVWGSTRWIRGYLTPSGFRCRKWAEMKLDQKRSPQRPDQGWAQLPVFFFFFWVNF